MLVTDRRGKHLDDLPDTPANRAMLEKKYGRNNYFIFTDPREPYSAPLRRVKDRSFKVMA